jgi:hypothetical protein
LIATKISLPFALFATRRSLSGMLALTFALSGYAASAQTVQPAETPAVMMAKIDLPDAPGTSSSVTESAPSATALYDAGYKHDQSRTLGMASHTDKYIEPGQPVPSLSVGNKFALGFKDAFSPSAAVGWVIAGAYAHATNGSPNYGRNSEAFGKRVGAAAARASSEGVFSDAVMASVLREDPRYYRMGPGHNFLKRIAYAGTRTIITKTDGGRTTPNFALLGGNLGGSYLTQTYYPDLNSSNTEMLKTFGGSIGGSAIGFVVSEFFPNINLFTMHRNHN